MSLIEPEPRLYYPGLRFTAMCYPHPEKTDFPQRNEVYVVCKDGSIQSVFEPGRHIGWHLVDEEDGWYYVTSEGRGRCSVFFHGKDENPPSGRDQPQHAEITEQTDEGIEVSS
jgi:outer membrane receptor for Fe3+-dicitrate